MDDNILGHLNCLPSFCSDSSNNFLIENSDIVGSTIIGTCIIDDCEPCIKVASCSSVSLYKGRAFVKSTRTNMCGNYVFTGLVSGHYTVVCKRKGLVTKCKDIVIDEDSVYMLNLLLERKKGTS